MNWERLLRTQLGFMGDCMGPDNMAPWWVPEPKPQKLQLS